MTTYDQPARLFKTLGHPARLAILDALRDGEQCVCHLEAVLGFRQAYISQQLTVLRGAGLIEDRRDGWNIFYRIIRPDLFSLLDAASLSAKPGRRKPAPVKDCPCPHCNPQAAPQAC